MIRSAAVKLTLWYLTIIMALSLSFSYALYRISSAELNRGFRRQTTFLARPLRLPVGFERLRVRQLNEGRQHLRQDLIVFNIVTLVLGGLAGYWLARRTLQ